jgi:hypothetical protein
MNFKGGSARPSNNRMQPVFEAELHSQLGETCDERIPP